MKFIKDNLFDIARFFNIFLAVHSIFSLVNNRGDVASNVLTLILSILNVILIISAEVLYKK